MPPPLHDALGREVRLDGPPRRIVSLVPSLTELLADLGLDDETVGLTRFCIHPADWTGRKAIVGGTKHVRVDRVAALRPDLVIANKEENVREQIEAVAHHAPVYVTDVASVAGAVDTIRTLGGLLHRAAAAGALADDIDAAFRSLQPARRRRALYLIWRDPWMTVGGDTYISDVMAHAGLDNVYSDARRYPVLAPEALPEREPEVALLSSEPYPFGERHLEEVRALIPGAEVRCVDGEAFSWYGSRMRRATDTLRSLQP